MNSLQKYIKLCLETRAFTYQPDDIHAKLQNELSPKLFNDKTNMIKKLSNEEYLN